MARWFYYRANGSGWLHVDGTVYRAENMDEALDMLDGIAPCLCGQRLATAFEVGWAELVTKNVQAETVLG